MPDRVQVGLAVCAMKEGDRDSTVYCIQEQLNIGRRPGGHGTYVTSFYSGKAAEHELRIKKFSLNVDK